MSNLEDRSTDDLLRIYFQVDAEVKAAEARAKQGKQLKELIAKTLGVRELSEGVESIRHSLGTIYKKEQTSVKVADKEAYKKWLFNTKRFELLQFLPYKNETLKFIEKEGVVPDGIYVRRWKQTFINRPAVKNSYIEE